MDRFPAWCYLLYLETQGDTRHAEVRVPAYLPRANTTTTPHHHLSHLSPTAAIIGAGWRGASWLAIAGARWRGASWLAGVTIAAAVPAAAVTAAAGIAGFDFKFWKTGENDAKQSSTLRIFKEIDLWLLIDWLWRCSKYSELTYWNVQSAGCRWWSDPRPLLCCCCCCSID